MKQTNWLYQNIDENSVDDAAKKAVEVVSSTTSALIKKATEADVTELEAYTIQRMDEKLPTGSDIEHYKMLKVQEPALDNRLTYLDVMCFLALFPSGTYGEFHPRDVKLSFSKYIKSRLLNRDARFQKNPEFIPLAEGNEGAFKWYIQCYENYQKACYVCERLTHPINRLKLIYKLCFSLFEEQNNSGFLKKVISPA